MTHELWAGLNSHIFHYLRSITLAELVRQQGPRGGEVAVLHDYRQPAASDRPAMPAEPHEPATTA
jgi:DNA-binding IscR family transcriptional regulator